MVGRMGLLSLPPHPSLRNCPPSTLFLPLSPSIPPFTPPVPGFIITLPKASSVSFISFILRGTHGSLGLALGDKLLVNHRANLEILGDAPISAHRLTLGQVRVRVLGGNALGLAQGRHAIRGKRRNKGMSPR